MIKQVLEHINNELEQLGLFTKFFTLAERISKDGISFPAVYEDEFKGIDFDFYQSSLYHVASEASFDILDSQTGCGTDFNYTIPFKLVGNVKKTDKYTLFDMAESVSITLLKSNFKELKRELSAYSVEISVQGFNSNSEDVFSSEFTGVDYKGADFFSVNYQVSISLSKACAITYDCDIPVNCGFLRVYDSDGNVVISGTSCNNYTINIDGNSVRVVYAQIPTSGTTILDAEGNTIGTWTDTSEIEITDLTSLNIWDFDVQVNEVNLVWDNSDDNINSLDDSLTTGGTLKLFTGRELFQRGSQLKIIIYA